MYISISGLEMKHKELNENAVVVSLIGYLDTYNSIDFYRYIDNMFLQNEKLSTIVLDCSMLNHVSSTGIGSFIQIMKSLRGEKRRLVFYRVQRKVKDVIDLLGFSGFLNFCNEPDIKNCLSKKTED